MVELTQFHVLAAILFLATTTLVSGSVMALAVRHMRRELACLTELNYDLQGRLMEIEDRADEAVGRLRVVTAEYSGGYETAAFGRVSAGGRERIETATAGASDPRLN